MTAQILFLAIGMFFLIIGLKMVSNAKETNKSLIPGYAVMGTGVVLGLGLGAGMFFEKIGNNMNSF